MRTDPPPTDDSDDQFLRRFGYRQVFQRTLRPFESFGVAFSFISITMALFVSFGFLLTVAGPRGIWIWPIAFAGQFLVCLVCAAWPRRSSSGHPLPLGLAAATPTVGCGSAGCRSEPDHLDRVGQLRLRAARLPAVSASPIRRWRRDPDLRPPRHRAALIIGRRSSPPGSTTCGCVRVWSA